MLFSNNISLSNSSFIWVYCSELYKNNCIFYSCYLLFCSGFSVQCPANFTLSENRNVAVIDVNTTLSFCFVIPSTPVHICKLNGIAIINSTENYITNLGYLVINNWTTSVSLNNRNINTLVCDAGDRSVQEQSYANFYSLSKYSIIVAYSHALMLFCSFTLLYKCIH